MAALDEKAFPSSLLTSDVKYKTSDLETLATNYKLPYEYIRRHFVIINNETKEGIFMLYPSDVGQLIVDTQQMHNARIEELTKRVEQVEKNVVSHVEKFGAKTIDFFEERIGGVEDLMQKRLKSIEANSNKQIKEMQEKMQEYVQEVETNITMRVDAQFDDLEK